MAEDVQNIFRHFLIACLCLSHQNDVIVHPPAASCNSSLTRRSTVVHYNEINRSVAIIGNQLNGCLLFVIDVFLYYLFLAFWK